ncbi:PREDICTED: probable carboxylesterase 5 [Camelina sativa]|uniref:Probable carboxylesterase 5 n=1 Tax=Camelina sativa TaxID=90675 RepID=A0ABM0VVT3_CAMSA|nr:PREDICTED: probable carboxylesterase 5 [Camelina sativa]
MESEIASEFLPFVRIYKDGRVERLIGNDIIPSSLDPSNDVVSKDVIYSPEHNLSVRLFLPHKVVADKKLPLLIYIHGGAWIIESPFSPIYHNYLASVTKSANCLAVSVQYRRAPEDPVPSMYEDVWSAIQWTFSHANGSGGGPEEWINKHADFDRVFLAGDSAGGNISHHTAMKAGEENKKNKKKKVDLIKIKGIAVVHPAFWGTDPVDEFDMQDKEMRSGIAVVWEKVASPNSVNGTDDPLFNVNGSGSDFSGLGCEKVLVAVAGKDVFWRQGLAYARNLDKCEWGGTVEVVEEKDEGHVFHLEKPDTYKALKFLNKFVDFITSTG